MHPLDGTEKEHAMAQYTGTVAWFNNSQGYGFLAREYGPDVYCHFSAIRADGYKKLTEGDEVEFDVVKGAKGDQADNVTVLKAALPHA